MAIFIDVASALAIPVLLFACLAAALAAMAHHAIQGSTEIENAPDFFYANVATSMRKDDECSRSRGRPRALLDHRRWHRRLTLLAGGKTDGSNV